MAVDYGERYVGVAITDRDVRLALRYSVIDQKRNSALDYLRDLVADEKIERILVGLPRALAGHDTRQTDITRAFITRLGEVLGDSVAIDEVDEVMTSKEAERRVRAEGGKIDHAHAEAARLMLETYLARR